MHHCVDLELGPGRAQFYWKTPAYSMHIVKLPKMNRPRTPSSRQTKLCPRYPLPPLGKKKWICKFMFPIDDQGLDRRILQTLITLAHLTLFIYPKMKKIYSASCKCINLHNKMRSLVIHAGMTVVTMHNKYKTCCLTLIRKLVC